MEYNMISEIREQDEAIHAILKELSDKKEKIRKLVQKKGETFFLGCGSSHYLGITGSALFSQMNALGHPITGGEVLVSEETLPPANSPLLISVSRSGGTTETVEATKRLQSKYPSSDTISITCNQNSSLTNISDISIVSKRGKEESIPATKSFSSALTAIEYLAMLKKSLNPEENFQKLGEMSKKTLENNENVARRIGENTNLEKFIFLGSGEYYGLALEGMLKIKESSLSWSEAYRSLEFRHGGKSILDENSLVVFFYPNQEKGEINNLIREICSLDSKVLIVGKENQVNKFDSDYKFDIPKGPSTGGLSLFIGPIQLMSYYKAVSLGLNPDNPKHLEWSVKI